MKTLATSRALVDDNTFHQANHLLTVQEVSEILKVPCSWVYERTRRRGLDRLPHYKMGKYLRFALAEVHAYLETPWLTLAVQWNTAQNKPCGPSKEEHRWLEGNFKVEHFSREVSGNEFGWAVGGRKS